MKFTVGSNEGKFDVPVGEHIGRFAGIEMMAETGQPRIGQDGKPMAPGMSWHWEIVAGPAAGKIAGRITGRQPSSKNVCGRMLSAVSGQWLQKGAEVDITQFIGRLYKIIVVPNENGDKTRVADNPPPQFYNGDPTAFAQQPSQSAPPPANGNGIGNGSSHGLPGKPASAPPSRPPSRPGTAPPPPAAKVRDFWVVWNQDGEGEPEKVSEADLRNRIQSSGHNADAVILSLVGDDAYGWKSIKEAGIDLTIPF